ncbi:MAG: hypothetical protein AB8B96_21785, partial [Lysobacterales bacterium]
VWNVHNEFHRGSGYRGQSKRRPRADWMIKRDTHEALISDEEAEALLAKLQNNPWKKSGRSTADYLLTGLLKTPSGGRWFGNGGKHYRTKEKAVKGAWVPLQELERAVLKTIASDLSDAKKIAQLTESARILAKKLEKQHVGSAQRKRLVVLEKHISKAMELVLEFESPAPVIRKIAEMEAERDELRVCRRMLERPNLGFAAG